MGLSTNFMLSPLRETVESLQQQVWQVETSRRPRSRAENVGHWLDQLLPVGVRARHAWTLLAIPGRREQLLLPLIAAREICRDEAVVVVDPAGRFFPPAAVVGPACRAEPAQASRLDLDQLIIVRPQNRADYLWTLNQALRSRGVGAVLSWPERLDARAFRTLQLAAEAGETLGLFVRPVGVRGQPSWSEAQLLIEPRPSPLSTADCPLPTASLRRRLRVEVVRCRGGKPGAFVELELDDETGTLNAARTVHLAPPLARAT